MQESHSIFTGVINYNNYNNWHIHPMERKIKKQQEAGRQPPRTPAAPPALRSRAEKGCQRFSSLILKQSIGENIQEVYCFRIINIGPSESV